MPGKYISKERKMLLEKAETYYQQWEEAKNGLAKSSGDFSKKLILVLVIGFSLMYIFRLLSDEEEEQYPVKKKGRSKSTGRLFRAAQGLAMPLLIKGVKNIIMGDSDFVNTKDEEHVD